MSLCVSNNDVIPNRAPSPVRACPVFAEAPSEAEGEAEGNLLPLIAISWIH